MILLLLPLVYFLPAVKGDVVLATGDGWAYSLPMRLLLGEMIRQGTLPLWNPYSFAGMPLLASVQPGVLYPPNWLFAFLSPVAAMNAVTIITYQIALIGAYLYARAVRMQRTAALVTALIFTFGGFMICHPEMTNYIASAAWLPWLVLGVEKLAQCRSWLQAWRWAAAGAAFIALQCYAGLPQATWQTMLVCGPYFLFRLMTIEETGRTPPASRFTRLRFVIAIAAMAACGLLLSLIQLLPTIELQQQGERAAISYDAFAAYPLAPRFLLTLIFPYFFGGGWPWLYHVGGWDEWWLLRYGYGYVGLGGLMLIVIAWRAGHQQRLVWFWSLVAALALLIAFGDYLPFRLNHLLWRVPVFNLFRGSYRHLLEITFAAAVLAGLGTDALAKLELKRARRAAIFGSLVLLLLVAGTAVIYQFFAHRLGAPGTPQPADTRLSNPEAFVPLLMFALSASAVWIYAKRRSALTGAVLLAVLLVDLASFGWFMSWRMTDAGIVRELADSVAVQAIKAREADLHSFRVVSQAVWPFGANYSAISHGCLAIARGLQSVNGYDPLRLPRPALMAGDQDLFGLMHDLDVMNARDQRLNLLNVKYLLREHSSAADERINRVVRGGEIHYDGIMNEMKLGPGQRIELEADGAAANELTIIAAAFNAAHLPDGTPLARLRLHTTDGRVIELEMQIGRDTAEWAYDRADIIRNVKHRRATVVQNSSASGDDGAFTAHRYLARFTFERAEIEYVEIEYAQPDAALAIQRALLNDAVTQTSTPLDRRRLAPERWRLVARCGQADLYENLKALPRAWFAGRIAVVNESEALRIIKAGRMPDGQPFNPAETALVEDDLSMPLPSARADTARPQVTISRYEPLQIELQTRSEEPGLLVLSEIDDRGWQAEVDGAQTPIHRTDYALRGIVVPAGAHSVRVVYRPASFRYGAWAAFVGLIVLVLLRLPLSIEQVKGRLSSASAA
ncbi:MAG TPA: YfhO family protein [Blastocatellia bacterium]|nr:YfhO family protein [Blastocatellia bacterium]